MLNDSCNLISVMGHGRAARLRCMLNLRQLPKTELHLHLEGAIAFDTLLQLVRKYDGRNCPSAGQLRQRLQYRDFEHFLRTWAWMTQHVRSEEDFEHIARGVAEALGEQGVLYAEVFFSPPDFFQHGLTIAGIARAIRRGLQRARANVEVRLICDLCRQHSVQLAAQWLEEVAAVRSEAGIVGIGLGGPEHLAPPQPYAAVYARAAELGLRRVAHAGEAAGPESVRGAVEALGVERIGHGVRAIEDPALVRELARRGVALEVCPTSNVRTGVVRSLAAHPIRALFDAGVPITLSSDDPTFFGADIVDEYESLRRLGFSDAELLKITRCGFEVSFLAERERAVYLRRLDRFAANA